MAGKPALALLRPYLTGDGPNADDEWDMHCPLHEDSKRSAQVNFTEGVWYCHAGCGGGSIKELLGRRDEWVKPVNGSEPRARARRGRSEQPVTEAHVKGWSEGLMGDESALDDLLTTRGLFTDTVIRFELGWDRSLSCYTIPVRDINDELVNVRRYQPRPVGERRKMWGVRGWNTPRLYPIKLLKEDPLIICEGELDSLITTQYGFAAITRTSSAKTWRADWSSMFEGKTIYVCHDADRTGQDANIKVGEALKHYAKEVRVVRLPYPVEEKHGKDLTDFWLDHDGDREAFRRLLEESKPLSGEAEEIQDSDPADAGVLDALDSRRVGSPLRLTVTVKGKREPGYSVPRKARYRCTRDAGAKCKFCPLYKSGDDEAVIAGSDPAVLEMIDSTQKQVKDVLRRAYGAVKCDRLTIEVKEYQSIEQLFARPSVDHVNGSGTGDYKNIKLTSVGRHDTMPNNTVRVVGALQPDPRRHLNEFLVWDVTRLETSLDRFEMDSKTMKLLSRFQPRPGQRPLKKLARIAADLSEHVTQIYGRPEMHAAIDLVFHSALGFNFNNKLVRGWLQLLVVGDTRTGKSEVANQLVNYYRAGEIISCESASFAGIVGGVQQYGASKEWAVTWGAIPINDRRLVVLDEVGGLSVEEIGAMSSVRSSGVAELTKIQQERTHARTRMIWLGNPRDARMTDYTYGVQSLRPLIGNNEDIARFDLALSVAEGEVSLDEINQPHEVRQTRYPADACHALVRWVWSRSPDQVVWARGAEAEVFKAARTLARRYVEDPPLVQGANVREKIARLAVALAARLFSTDSSGERIVVHRAHVEDAVALVDTLYGMSGFGYAERSRELLANREQAESKRALIAKYLRNKRGLASFLRERGSFRRQDIEEVLNVDREEANAVINTLWESRMVRKERGDIRIEPTLHDLLKEV